MTALTTTRSRGLLYLTVCLVLVLSTSLNAADPFTIIALPDTQHYSDDPSHIQHFENQTQWIVDNIASENIPFVTHLGDFTQSGNDPTEWDRSLGALNTLENGNPSNTALVPYSVSRGNHDDISSFQTYLGASRYTGESWYGGGSSDNLCHYQTFSAGGYDFLHLNLTFEPTSSHLSWAQGVINANPGVPTIVTTHGYIDVGGYRIVEGAPIWEDLINNNSQIFMALCGHMHGEYQQISTNAAGGNVIEMLSNYQDYPEGGMGYLRKIEFDVPNSRINVRTYSPSLDAYLKDDDSYFSYDVTFGATEITVNGQAALPGDVRETTFQEGLNGYDGTTDTQVLEEYPDSSYGSTTTLKVDSSDPGGSGHEDHVLIRFDDLFGTEEGQVPAGSEIFCATLMLNVSNEGSAFTVHRMLQDWSDSATWNSLMDGISADDVEALAEADATTSSVSEGLLEIDVTESLIAWLNGEANFGWALLPTDSDGVGFYSSEYETDESLRPMLRIKYEVPEPTSVLLLAVGAVATLSRPHRRGSPTIHKTCR
ncbi:MAG: DNRLRE domain-containing protein [Phycisphaerae bacterium]|nr:DNRLRE domain-containing protein [Phycisphaerae bacterium]